MYIFQIKYTEAILSNSTRKLLWFEITKMLIAALKINLLCHFKNNFRHTFVPYRTTGHRRDWRETRERVVYALCCAALVKRVLCFTSAAQQRAARVCVKCEP